MEHLTLQLNNMLEEGGKEIYAFTEFVEVALALAYQLCYLPDEASQLSSTVNVLNVYRYASGEQKKEIIRFLRDLPHEQQNNKMSINGLNLAK